MKNLLLIAIITFLYAIAGCKKEKTENCGCNSNEVKYRLTSQAGTLSYFASKNKWVFVYQPLPGNYSYYFPCNTSQDSLIAILQGANISQTFNVKISGKVKSTCPNEDFGVTSGITTFDYINIDSLKRN